MLQQLLPISTQAGVISFALGLPATEFFPIDLYQQSVSKVLECNPSALQYGPGLTRLKQHITNFVRQRGITCKEEQIFLTAGAQQGISLLTRLLLNPGEQVLVESIPTRASCKLLHPTSQIFLQYRQTQKQALTLTHSNRYFETADDRHFSISCPMVIIL